MTRPGRSLTVSVLAVAVLAPACTSRRPDDAGLRAGETRTYEVTIERVLRVRSPTTVERRSKVVAQLEERGVESGPARTKVRSMVVEGDPAEATRIRRLIGERPDGRLEARPNVGTLLWLERPSRELRDKGQPAKAVGADHVVDGRQRGIRVRRSTSAPQNGPANIEVDAFFRVRDDDYHPTRTYTQLVGSETSYRGVTRTETKEVLKGPDAASALACIVTIVCLASDFGTPTKRTVTETVRVPGPATLTTVLTGPLTVETSTLTAARSSQLLEEASTATVQLHGTLPAGAGVPPDLAGRNVEGSAERRYSRRLTSEWPRFLPPAPPWVAVALLVLVGGWLAVEGRRWVRRPSA